MSLESKISSTKVNLEKAEKQFGPDPFAFYVDYYLGVVRSDLKSRNYLLYDYLKTEDQLCLVPTSRSGFENNVMIFYYQHYRGVTPTRLKSINPMLYREIRDGGYLPYLPKKPRNFGKDPREYCKKHYPGITRNELRKKDPSLYESMRRKNRLRFIPLNTRAQVARAKSRYGPTPESALAYYHKHYPGVFRTQLHTLCSRLYNRMKDDGTLDQVPVASQKDVQRQASKYGLDAAAYYNKHFRNVPREKLLKRANGLYRRLEKENKLDCVPTVEQLKQRAARKKAKKKTVSKH